MSYIAIFDDEEPVAIYWPDVVAVEHSLFYKGTRVLFRHGGDVVTRTAAVDVIEAWHEWMEVRDV